MTSYLPRAASISAFTTFSSRSRPPILTEKLQSTISGSPVPLVGLCLSRIDEPFELTIEADRVFHAASTMKVPVMVEAFQQEREGEISLDDQIILRNEFRSALDGTSFSTTVEEDLDPEIYSLLGTPLSFRELVVRMITKSSNLATNILIERLGALKVNESMGKLECSDMKVLRGVEDNKAYRAGIVNRATARAFCKLLRLIALGDTAGDTHSSEMLEIMAHQEHRSGIPLGVAGSAKVCNKTGNLDSLFHDGAVVISSDGPAYSLVVFTEGAPWKRGAELVANLSEICWDHLHKVRS